MKSQPYTDIEASPAYQLWQATNAWQRRIRRALEPFRLTHVQYILLASIDLLTKEDASPTQVEVSRYASLDVNMTSQVLRGLESRGLVVRTSCQSDKRAHLLSLTEKGHDLRLAARQVVKPVTAAFFAPLGNDLQSFVEKLRVLNQGEDPTR